MTNDKTMKVFVSNKADAQTNTTPATLAEGEIIFLKQDGSILEAGTPAAGGKNKKVI